MVNYIVSGLERSGTSLMMQILEKAGIDIVYDESRKADENNPRGYYELEGGKIINKLRKQSIDLSKYDDKFIKITSYGIGCLPPGNYSIIYMQRDLNEVIDSTQKMSNKKFSRKKLKKSLQRLDNTIINEMRDRIDIEYVIVNYNKLLSNYDEEIKKVNTIIDKFNADEGKKAIDERLYRNRRKKSKISKEDEDIIKERLRELGYLD